MRGDCADVFCGDDGSPVVAADADTADADALPPRAVGVVTGVALALLEAADALSRASACATTARKSYCHCNISGSLTAISSVRRKVRRRLMSRSRRLRKRCKSS